MAVDHERKLGFEFIYIRADREIFSEEVSYCPRHMRIPSITDDNVLLLLSREPLEQLQGIL